MSNTQKNIFKDAALNEQFVTEGYVVVDLLSAAKIEQLSSLYHSSYPQGVKGYYSTIFDNNIEHRNKIHNEISKICTADFDRFFENYKSYISIFIVKAPGEDSELKLHQDMTLVDEDMYAAVNVWCPLVDLNTTNGVLQVLPGSHTLVKSFRGASFPNVFEDVRKEIQALMKPFYLKAGQALIFDQSLIHYSSANLSGKDRPAVNTLITHKDARLRTCFWDGKPGQVEIFEQEESFLLQFDHITQDTLKEKRPGRSLGLFPYHFPRITLKMLEERYGKKRKPSFLNKLFSKK